ncbi:MAG TPA: bifunctional class I SAM-dependent methyltransferase/GNAT family N-acetyltransferase [Candidatus Binatia bacterium]|nr:bifunctional class I SAM-dependent methyltransferase/GNAT family N-acetyltransferase [Candidatus Binatia bacterium]
MRDAAKFFDQVSFYEQVLDRDYMFHNAIYLGVAAFLADYFGDRPFSVLDLGCGSARHFSRALAGRNIQSYTGYDLSEASLLQARRNLADLGCPVELRAADLLDALRKETRTFDLIFCGFSLHHLPGADKAEFFRRAHRRALPSGALLIVDIGREENEPKQLYLDRYCGWIQSEWSGMAPEGVDAICQHIRECDFPETAYDMRGMATESGFRDWRAHERFRWHHVWSCVKDTAPAIRIRDGVADDAAAIARVHIESWRTTYAGIIPGDYIAKFASDSRERTWRGILAESERRSFVCVAEDEEGTIVGFASGGRARGEATDYAGEIYAIYLMQPFQRRGIGRRLAAALARRLLGAGRLSMIVWVLAENSSRAFYSALGGVLVDKKPAEIAGADLTEVAYGWTDIRRLID